MSGCGVKFRCVIIIIIIGLLLLLCWTYTAKRVPAAADIPTATHVRIRAALSSRCDVLMYTRTSWHVTTLSMT